MIATTFAGPSISHLTWQLQARPSVVWPGSSRPVHQSSDLAVAGPSISHARMPVADSISVAQGRGRGCEACSAV